MKIYAARDRDGKLWLYFNEKPFKALTYWSNGTDDGFCETSEDLPSVKWEDNEPTEVEYDDITHELKIKLKRKR